MLRIKERQLLFYATIIAVLVNLLACSPSNEAGVERRVSEAATSVAQAATSYAVASTSMAQVATAAPAVQTEVAGAVATVASIPTQIPQVYATVEAVATTVDVGLIDRGKVFLGFEAPAITGQLKAGISTAIDRDTIRSAFVDAFKRMGGGRRLGQPTDKVALDSGRFVQLFQGGEYGRSVIVMLEAATTAYVIPGEWLEKYEKLGGPATAGYPTSDPTSWGASRLEFWRRVRGERQLYSFNGTTYALMKADGTDRVHVIPPKFWSLYSSEQLRDKIGYPVSSYPFDDSGSTSTSGIPQSSRDVLNAWLQQPYRMQVFQFGSIIFDDTSGIHEVIESKSLQGGDGNFALGLSRAFNEKYLDSLMIADSSCMLQTLEQASRLTSKQFHSTYLTRMIWLPLKATLSAVTLGREVMMQLALSGARELLDQAIDRKPLANKEVIVTFIAGTILDSFYAKAVGDYLADPLSDLTVTQAKSELERLHPDRLSIRVSAKKSSSTFGFPNDIAVVATYDPATRMASGVISSECMPEGIAFQYRVDPTTAYALEKSEGVWDGRPIFWDLASQSPIR